MIIPFFIPHAGCPHQCVFCNQKNITGQVSPPKPSSLSETIDTYLKTRTGGAKIQVAFYGGTFTALPLSLQRSYLEAVEPYVLSGRIKSIRMSTRPDCINGNTLDLLKERHVETVELGAQAMDDRVLSLSGRGHTSKDTIHAAALLKERGFKVGLQLMPGLPGDSGDLFAETVKRTIALKPDLVRLYPALVVRDTPLEGLFRAGRFFPLTLEEAVAVCRQALVAFEAAGIEVVRIGLQPTEELEKEGTVIAGPYHPAFRQLVEASLMLDAMETALSGMTFSEPEVRIFVNPRDLSNAAGQKRSNLPALKELFRLARIELQPDEALPRRTIRCEQAGQEK